MRAFGFVGSSGSGKTTLAERVIRELASRGRTVAAVKNSHHGVDVDTPGKDTWRFREAGARQVLLSTAERWALMTEVHEGPEPIEALLARLDPADIVVVEGFKGRGDIPRIEVRRAGNVRPALWPQDARVVALACDAGGRDAARAAGCRLPILDVDDARAVTDFIESFLGAGKWA